MKQLESTHASIENNPVALQLLLEKGADPRRANNRGTNVLMLMMKRSQLEMADMCMTKVLLCVTNVSHEGTESSKASV